MELEIKSKEEETLKRQLREKKDPESERLVRFLNMPDLSRLSGSPIYELAERIKKMENFADFDVLKVPEIVPADISFNLFDLLFN